MMETTSYWKKALSIHNSENETTEGFQFYKEKEDETKNFAWKKHCTKMDNEAFNNIYRSTNAPL